MLAGPRTALALLALVSAAACGGGTGDEPVQPEVPPPAGKHKRIHEVRDPTSRDKAAHRAQVEVSGAVVVAVDQYDETRNGRSAGTIYVADLGSTAPYSGISLFNPSFVPGNLRVSPGDALDLRGEYQENNVIGTLQFAPGVALIQLANPIGTFRFDTRLPPVKVIDVRELANYETGVRWLNMLVKVTGITLQRDADRDAESGRNTAGMIPDVLADGSPAPGFRPCNDPFPKAPTLVNELMDLKPLGLRQGMQPKSITGIVTFFCNFHLAPRTPADVEL